MSDSQYVSQTTIIYVCATYNIERVTDENAHVCLSVFMYMYLQLLRYHIQL